MNDLISRKAVMEELLAIQDVTYMSTCLTVEECKGKRWMIARAIDAVKDVPTIDVEPVRHGHWIPWLNAKDEFGRQFTAIYMCSECKAATHCYQSDYCPNCGAKMDEEDNT